MIWWRRGEERAPQAPHGPSRTAGGPASALDGATPPALPPTAAPEDEDVDTLVARVLDAADHPAARPAPAPIRTDPGPERSPEGGFHVEHGDRAATDPDEATRQPPTTDPEALAWRWRRGQGGSRPPPPPTDEHQAVTVRTVGAPVTEDVPRHDEPQAPGHDEPPAPRTRQSESVEELERARHLATGAWQQPPDDAGSWARVAGELPRP